MSKYDQWQQISWRDQAYEKWKKNRVLENGLTFQENENLTKGRVAMKNLAKDLGLMKMLWFPVVGFAAICNVLLFIGGVFLVTDAWVWRVFWGALFTMVTPPVLTVLGFITYREMIGDPAYQIEEWKKTVERLEEKESKHAEVQQDMKQIAKLAVEHDVVRAIEQGDKVAPSTELALQRFIRDDPAWATGMKLTVDNRPEPLSGDVLPPKKKEFG